MGERVNINSCVTGGMIAIGFQMYSNSSDWLQICINLQGNPPGIYTGLWLELVQSLLDYNREYNQDSSAALTASEISTKWFVI